MFVLVALLGWIPLVPQRDPGLNHPVLSDPRCPLVAGLARFDLVLAVVRFAGHSGYGPDTPVRGRARLVVLGSNGLGTPSVPDSSASRTTGAQKDLIACGVGRCKSVLGSGARCRGAGDGVRACGHAVCVRVADVRGRGTGDAASGGRVVCGHVASGDPCDDLGACVGGLGVARDQSIGVGVGDRRHARVPRT